MLIIPYPCYMKRLFLLLLLSCIAGSLFAQVDKDVMAIRKLLLLQVQEWNKGNIDGYMHGYWESDSLLFIGSKGPRYGYQNTLSNYKKAYPDADHMGKLKTTVVSMERLSPEYYFIVGKWALERKAGDVSGSYTLLLKKIKDQWVIVCDHSS